jgi:hypothetical protein
LTECGFIPAVAPLLSPPPPHLGLPGHRNKKRKALLWVMALYFASYKAVFGEKPNVNVGRANILAFTTSDFLVLPKLKILF